MRAPRSVMVFVITLVAVGCSLVFPIPDDATSGSPEAGNEDAAITGDALPGDAAPIEASGGEASVSDGGCVPNPSFADDPEHCGACGHSCLGGACKSGSCLPVELATGQTGTHWLALDDASIVWTDGKSVRACPKSGCGGAPIDVVSGRTRIIEVATGNGTVFWTECDNVNGTGDGGAFSCPTAGCASGPTPLVEGFCLLAIAADPTNGFLYFATDTTVHRCAMGASCSSSLVAADQYFYVSSITLHEGKPYWLESQRGLSTCSGANCAPAGARLIAESQRNAITPPSLSAGRAYWTAYWAVAGQVFAPEDVALINNGSGGRVVRAPLDQDGGSAEVLVAGGSPTAVVADDTAIRFADYQAGIIYSCPLSGCDAGASPIVAGLGKPYALVQDQRAIYWANYGDGRIMKLAK